MPIVSSQIAEDRAQVDGRRHVTEVHTDHLGVQHRVFYKAQPDADVQARMLARAVEIGEQLAEAELLANLAEVLS